MPIAISSDLINLSSENKTEEIANIISKKLKSNDVVFLYGEMGVGKTTFVKYLINKLQLKFDNKIVEVTSPTFNIMNEYYLGDFVIKHYDLYRLKSDDELKELNLFENDNDDIIFIEWPEIIKKKPSSVIKLYFEYKNDFKERFLKVLYK